MLPSLSTSISVPVSAAIRLAPVMPTSACRNFFAQALAGKLGKFFASVERKVGLELTFEKFSDAFAAVVQRRRDVMWEGCSSATCKMNSARSLSATSMPAPSKT